MSRPRSPAFNPEIARMDIRLIDRGPKDCEVKMFTWWRGHAFDGWITTEGFRRAEADGVLAWDSAGAPVIRAKDTKTEG